MCGAAKRFNGAAHSSARRLRPTVRPTVRPSGFNGAAHSSARRLRRTRTASCPWSASTEPRTRVRGDDKATAPAVAYEIALQRSRALECAETLLDLGGKITDLGFNGAAHSSARRLFLFFTTFARWPSFNGAAHSSARRQVEGVNFATENRLRFNGAAHSSARRPSLALFCKKAFCSFNGAAHSSARRHRYH